MESPYREKHIFQGTSRGKVFITSQENYFQCQDSSTYDSESVLEGVQVTFEGV